MPFTNDAVQRAIYHIGSRIPDNNYIQYFALGSGSGTATINDTTLIAESGNRMIITGSPNFATPRKVTFQADWNSVQLSGLQLTEFGLFASGGALTGSLFVREAFNTITFDGTNELQIQETIEGIAG